MASATVLCGLSLACVLKASLDAASAPPPVPDTNLIPIPVPPGVTGTATEFFIPPPPGLTKTAGLSAAAPSALSTAAATRGAVPTAAPGASSAPVAATLSAAALAALAAKPVAGLAAPAALAAVAGNRTVALSWVQPRGSGRVAGYLVYRGTDAAHIRPVAINLKALTGTAYDDDAVASVSGPRDRCTYYYKVRAFAADGLLSPYSDTVTARPSGPLLPPGGFTAVPEDGAVVLRWRAPLSTGDADLGEILLLKGGAKGPPARYRVLPPDTLSFTDKGLADGTPVSYALLSQDTRGNQSPPTKVLQAVPYRALDAPSGLDTLGLGDNLVRLKWGGSAGGGTYPLAGYDVYRAPQGKPLDYSKPLNKVLLTDTYFEDGPEDSVAAPKLGTRYVYTVKAVDAHGWTSAPCKPAAGAPVASITKLEAGTIDITSGNTLQISGRKTINLSNTWILWRQNQGNTYGASSPSSFALNQQLQVQMSGNVGRKIKVDVDYNDQAAANQQQKISVVYNGDSDEVFKQFAFGDINMDMSSNRTEFVNYNKTLFGAKLQLDSPDGRLRLTAIGAQTQGFTETKTFVGGYEEAMTGTTPGQNYPDTAFVAYKYYYLSREEDLLEGTNSVVPGSVAIYVDEPGVSNYNPNRVTVTNPSTQTTFNFVPLNAGVDYLVDNKTGLITFNVPIQPNYNIFVAYKTAQADSSGRTSEGYNAAGQVDIQDGAAMNSDNLLGATKPGDDLIQDGSLNGSTSYDGHMCVDFYNLGNQQIMNPSLDPTFQFVIYGPNQSIVYQMDPHADYTNVVNFDTTLGNMVFRVPYPFAQGNGLAEMQAESPFLDVGTPYNGGRLDCYDLVQRTNNYTIHVVYQHKLNSYELRPNIMQGSDNISVDGRHLNRNVDYFLDYTTGILVFNNPDLITPSSTVRCTYEYLPFGDQFTSTVWGVRAEYDLTDDLSVGSTYLSDSANAPQNTPSITSGVYSLQVLDGDVQAQVPQKTLDSLTHAISPRSGFLSVKASAEAATSWFNPNTYSRNNENGVAMVDDFESVNSTVATSTLRDNWFPSSIPVALEGDAPTAAERTFTHLWTVMEPAYNAAALTQEGDDPQVNMLELDWRNFSSPSDWDAYVYSFGPTPNQSTSQAGLLQVWLKATAAVTLHIDVGQISEDAADTGVMETESTTGVLASGEDIGIVNPATVGSPYPCPQNDPSRYPDQGYWGWKNGVLDTEDFDQTGVLDTANNYYSFSVKVDPANQSASSNNGFQELNLDMTQQAVQAGVSYGIVGDAALMSTVPGSSTYYTNISRVRVWIDGAGASQGGLTIQSISFVGNKWQVRADPNVLNQVGTSVTANTNAFQVQAINSSSALSVTADVAYVPDLDFYTVDSTHSATLEQALELQYALTTADMSDGRPYYQARDVLSTAGTPVDFGTYQNMRVDLFKPAYVIDGRAVSNLQGETFLIRLAADDQDYFEYSIPLDSFAPGGWTTKVVALDGSDGNRIQVGTPYLRQINYVAFSVRTVNSTLNYAIQTPLNQESLWVDNLRVTDPVSRDGGAQRFAVNYDLMKGKIVVNQTYRSVDSDFIQIDQQDNAPAQHSVNQDVNAQVNLVKGLPVALDYATDQLFTDGQNQGDPFYSQNFTQPNENDNKTSAAVDFTRVPGLDVNAKAATQYTRQLFLPTYVAAQKILQNNPDFNPDNSQSDTQESVAAAFTVPSKLPVLGGDKFGAEADQSSAKVAFDQPLTLTGSTNFEDTDTDTDTLKGNYAGSYHWGKWAVFSPSYNFSETFAKGDIVAPGVIPGQGTPYYSLDEYGRVDRYVPQQRIINPVVSLQAANLGPVQGTKLDYNFTQTMDYVQNLMTTPGSLNFATNLNLASLGRAFKVAPPLALTQIWQVNSQINDDVTVRGPWETAYLGDAILDNPVLGRQFGPTLDDPTQGLGYVPNIALESKAPFFESVWWPRFGGGKDVFGEMTGPLDIEDLAASASRQSTTTLNSHFNMPVAPGWVGDFTPRLTVSDARTMSEPEEITENIQRTYGSGIVFLDPRIPWSAELKPQNLTLDTSYTTAQNWVDDVETPPYLSSSATGYNLTATLPMKPNPHTTLTLSLGSTFSGTTTYNLVDGRNEVASQSNTFTLTPGVRLIYLWNMVRPIRLPNFWPFYGREMRLSQALRLDNNLTAVINSAYQDASTATLQNTASDLYTLTNTVSYNVLQNVKASLALEQDYMEDPYASQAINQPGGYYTIKLSVGAEATF